MTRKELKEISKKQLKGSRLKFAILTLITFCIIGLEYYILHNIQSNKILNLVISSFVVVVVSSIYLSKARTGNMNIRYSLKNWKAWLRNIALNIIVIIILNLLTSVIIRCFTAPFIFDSAPSDFVVSIIRSSTLIIMTILILLVIIVLKINFIPAIYLLIDGNTLKESISGSFRLMSGHK